MKCHVARRGAKEGQLVKCSALIKCKYAVEEDHLDFPNGRQLEQYNDMMSMGNEFLDNSRVRHMIMENVSDMEGQDGGALAQRMASDQNRRDQLLASDEPPEQNAERMEKMYADMDYVRRTVWGDGEDLSKKDHEFKSDIGTFKAENGYAIMFKEGVSPDDPRYNKEIGGKQEAFFATNGSVLLKVFTTPDEKPNRRTKEGRRVKPVKGGTYTIEMSSRQHPGIEITMSRPLKDENGNDTSRAITGDNLEKMFEYTDKNLHNHMPQTFHNKINANVVLDLRDRRAHLSYQDWDQDEHHVVRHLVDKKETFDNLGSFIDGHEMITEYSCFRDMAEGKGDIGGTSYEEPAPWPPKKQGPVSLIRRKLDYPDSRERRRWNH